MPLTKVTSGVIAANAVVDSFGTQSITGDKIGLTAINANNIVNNTITGAKIALGTITGDDIAVNQITGNLLTANCVSGNNIVSGVSLTGNVSITGNVVVGAGTVSNAAISTTGDPNTGVFFPAADTIAFTEGGTEAMRLNSSGFVGIDNTSPDTRFVVGGVSAAANTNWIQFRTNVGGTNPPTTNPFGLFFGCNRSNGSSEGNIAYRHSLTFANWSGSTYTEVMRIADNNNLLVNTSGGLTYGARFQVYESGSNRAASFQTEANDQAVLSRCSLAGFSNTVQYTTVDRSASSGFNLMQMVTGGTADNEFVFRGDGNGYADGTWNNNGADYAEYFESATGQAIPVGSSVVLENNKVRVATVLDDPSNIIGVVRPKEPSKASMIVGNTAWNKWANKYLTDDFDRYIMEDHDVIEWTDVDGRFYSYESHRVPDDVVVPTNATIKTHDDKGNKFQHHKLNPEWNPDAEYINRENRDEWLIIGLVGQVKVLKGQIMGDRWKKMRDVSATVEEWFIR